MISFKQFLNESEILRKYTSTDQFNYYKGDIAREFSNLRADYPYDGGKLYRGLNFSSAKQYLAFRRSIKNGFVVSDTITSWSPDIGTARQFAKSPQVFSIASLSPFSYDPNERVSGFVGAVLVTSVSSGVGIDVRKSQYSSESEVILPAGKYKVEDMIIEKKWKHIINKLDINQEVVDIINSGRAIDNELARQLFRYKGGDLYDDVKRKILDHAVKTFISTNKINITLDSSKNTDFAMYNEKERQLLFPDGKYKFNVYGSMGMLDFFHMKDVEKYLSNRNKQDIRNNIIGKINKVTKVLKGKKADIEYSNGFNHLNSMFDMKLTDFNYLSQSYANTYSRFNQLLRDWNSNRHFDVSNMTELFKQSLESPFR